MRFYEFFSGAGMARVGFGPNARCLFANDFDPLKCAAYTEHFGGAELHEEDIRALSIADLRDCADVAWASSPCVDLSAAGRRAGLDGPQSSMAFAFLRLIAGLRTENRAPRMIIIENVEGLVSANGGRDLAAAVSLIAAIGYRVGALVIDAKLFLPQSRARVFVIAVRNDVTLPGYVVTSRSQPCWHPSGLERALSHVSPETRRQWVWWTLPLPAPRMSTLADVLEADPKGVRWDSAATTARLLGMMSETNRAKVAAAVAAARTSRRPIVAAFCQRTRYHKNGEKVQRAEIRFDGLTGCLRTATGGSSRQRLLFIEGADIRSRLVSPREGARLMGLPENFELPTRFGNAMKLIGDGVAVPVVEHLTRHLIMPILGATTRLPARAAVIPYRDTSGSRRAIEKFAAQSRSLARERPHVRSWRSTPASCIRRKGAEGSSERGGAFIAPDQDHHRPNRTTGDDRHGKIEERDPCEPQGSERLGYARGRRPPLRRDAAHDPAMERKLGEGARRESCTSLSPIRRHRPDHLAGDQAA